ncbi:PRC-barrel domain-containing protein [Streptomyces odonnellii]|uniref:PRC-barrel domain-containing protein n=1 Tax=Streptomyces odonnellii TaxID=1417980 RepID=UPI000626C4E6|nr:PRC-barrel domain-containing protein [Streptomyces odonnellii]
MSDSIWGYHETSGRLADSDLTGYKVEATDGSIGEVDKHSDKVDSSYIVVDTGPWILGKEVLLPVGTVTRIDTDDRKIYVDRTKEQIKNAPEFHRDKHLHNPAYTDELGTYYGTGGTPFDGRPL